MTKTGTNIYRRKDGRYEGRYQDGFKEDGKPKYRSVYGYSREEVEQKLKEICSDFYSSASGIRLTVCSLFHEWIQAINSRVKESTIANYRMKAEKHILSVFGNMECTAVSPSKVHKFIHDKMNSGLSARYVSDIVILRKSMFKYANRMYHMYNPIANVLLPKKKKTEIQLLNDEEQNRLKAYLLKHQTLTSLGIAVSLYTGLRIGELCALKWEDIDFEKRTLTVSHTVQRIRKPDGTKLTQLIITEPKSSSSMRTIPIPDCLTAILRGFQAESNIYVMTNTDKPLEPRTMQYRFASVLKNEKLPSIHFHALRHMFATKSIALGFDAKSLSEILGHSSVEITLNKYVHSSMEQKRKCMELFSSAA